MSKYYAVIDTNVLVSAMLKWDSIPGKLMDAVFDGLIIPVVSEVIIDEYLTVLSREKFSFPKNTVNPIIEFFNNNAVVIKPDKTDIEFIDPKDAVFYEVTMKEREEEDAYLVTGNSKHFPAKHYVVTPRRMLDIIS